MGKISEIDLCMIAILRPDVVKRTLDSFFKFRQDSLKLNLTLNIDPVGMGTSEDVIEVVSHYPVEIKDIFIQSQPSYTKAVCRVWSGVDTEFAFYLEDDWEFQKPFNLDRCIEYLRGHPDISSIVFEADLPDRCEEGREFVEIETRGFPGPPYVLRRDFIHKLAIHLNKCHQMNPVRPNQVIREALKQKSKLIRESRLRDCLERNKKRVIYTEGIVRDIGREWQEITGVRVDKNG